MESSNEARVSASSKAEASPYAASYRSLRGMSNSWANASNVFVGIDFGSEPRRYRLIVDDERLSPAWSAARLSALIPMSFLVIASLIILDNSGISFTLHTFSDKHKQSVATQSNIWQPITPL